MPNSAAIAILPFNMRPPSDLSKMPLDSLEWPVGRPSRLSQGTVAEMAEGDHLVLFPYKGVWTARLRKVRAQVSLAILEPRAYHRKHMLLAAWMPRRFRHVLTSDTILLERLPNAVFVPFGTSWVPDFNALDRTKTRNLSLIASKKRSLPGHKLRHTCVDWIRAEKVDADILGRKYMPFERKSDGLAPYRFSVVVENVREKNYFTEKLLDAVLCRTVPIYWGCPNIGDFMDTSGMILCESFEDIQRAIRAASPALYEEKRAGLLEAEPAAVHFADYHTRAAQALRDAITQAAPSP